MIVPRGGKGLIERVRAEARVPVLSHLDGNCHTYLHAAAAAGMALEVAVNAKTVAITPDVYQTQEDSTVEVLGTAGIAYTAFAQPRPKSGRIQILAVHVKKVTLDPSLRLEDVAALTGDRKAL